MDNYKDEFEEEFSKFDNHIENSKDDKPKKTVPKNLHFKENVKARAYEILSSNFNKRICSKQLMQEFQLSEKTIYNYLKEVEAEIVDDNKERKEYIKINVLNKLFEITTNSKNNFEVIKAIETIIKLTGISEEVIKTENVNMERKFIIELKEEEGEDKDGNE
jgi:AraC-like DNA-binding protein